MIKHSFFFPFKCLLGSTKGKLTEGEPTFKNEYPLPNFAILCSISKPYNCFFQKHMQHGVYRGLGMRFLLNQKSLDPETYCFQ